MLGVRGSIPDLAEIFFFFNMFAYFAYFCYFAKFYEQFSNILIFSKYLTHFSLPSPALGLAPTRGPDLGWKSAKKKT